MKNIALILLFGVFMSCEILEGPSNDDGGNPSSSGEEVSIPTVNLTCLYSSTNCAASADGNYAWIVFLDDDSNVEAQTLATISCDSTSCTVAANENWVDASLSNIDEMTDGEYNLGVYIDINGNTLNYSSLSNAQESGTDVRCISADEFVDSSTSSISILACQTVP